MMRLIFVLLCIIALNIQNNLGQNLSRENLPDYPGINLPFSAEIFDLIDQVSYSIIQQDPDVQSIEVEIEYYVEYFGIISGMMSPHDISYAYQHNNTVPYEGFDISANPYLFTEYANLISNWSYPDCSFAFYQKPFYYDKKLELAVSREIQGHINPKNQASLKSWSFLVGPGERNKM